MRFAEIAGKPRSAEQIFRDYLEPKAEGATPVPASDTKSKVDANTISSMAPAILPGDLGEHLFLLARWYYSNPREGEIFFQERDWPYRRILRACSRLLNHKLTDADAKAHSKANAENPETQTGTASDEKGTS